jgi:hypothetical protein
MTIFEPLFILLFLATVATLATATVAALRGRLPHALQILRRLAVCAAFYFAVVLIVAFAAVPPVHRVGEPQCFDDWCITVTNAKRTGAASAQSWRVALRISSRALRVVQRENGAAVHLVDSNGRTYRPDPTEMTVPLDGPVGPGESFDAERRFELPADATDVRLVYNHEGGFPIGALIIGENQLFHDTTVIALDGAVPCSVNSIGTTTPCEPAI